MQASADVLAADGLLERYRRLCGGVDEMVSADGQLRPVWRPFVDLIAGLSADALSARFARADQYLKDAGVYYRVYGRAADADERQWPLAPVPVLIDEAEWRGIGQGLVQRAELLERMAADLHGPQQLVRDGLLPAGLIAANPGFLHPLVGLVPRDGHYLHFLAFELGRGPDGRWWVLGDRTQAPSGAGFALENRVATMRAFPDLPAGMHPHRLAGFFRHFREALLAQAGGRAGEVAILTPGADNETYYEHAWIARYLGLMLLEGEDLSVRNGRVMVRTVSGLQPISVLWRRLDAVFMDPLELNADSHIGCPGFVGALRAGSVSVVNALGAGLLETRALAAFLPNICQALTGTDLVLPGIATWWCGQAEAREQVIGALERMMLGPALATQLPYDDPQATLLGARLDPDDRRELLQRLRRDGAHWVAQEAVTLSTTPAWVDGRLEPRPFVLRAYAARTAEGWQVMPGGFGRVGAHTDVHAISMRLGGQAADVWVVSPDPVSHETLITPGVLSAQRRAGAELPSRAAENLLWLGRYAERSETIARVLRAYQVRLAENLSHPPPLLEALRAHMLPMEVDLAQPIPDGLLRSFDGASLSAGRIRDRFSPDGWAALHDLSTTAYRFSRKVVCGDDASRAATVLLRKLAGFSGLLHENMYRSPGWCFLEIGRRIERGLQVAQLLALLGEAQAPDGLPQALLEIGDSVMTYRNRYGVQTEPANVIDLLALDPRNPRAVMFQLEALQAQFAQLPATASASGRDGLARQLLRLHAGLSLRDPDALAPAELRQLAEDIGGLYVQLAQVYFH
ncbi:MAG: circularly permuted type 2 ATP-grasp protein [Pseudomonas sp.]